MDLTNLLNKSIGLLENRFNMRFLRKIRLYCVYTKKHKKKCILILSFFYSSRDSIASHLRSHGNIAKQKNVKSVLGDSGEEMESSQTLSKTLKNRKRKQGKKPPTKTEPRTCLECGWVSKSRLLHDRHLLATHGIQVPQV